MFLFRLLAGISLLTLGRKLYWLFVGAVGFVVAMALATKYLPVMPEWQTLLLALAAGVVGAVLAVLVQRIAVAVAGFLAGGYLAAGVAQMFNWDPGQLAWVVVLAGGILCAILAAKLFDWALIVVSSLAGAMVIAQSFTLPSTTALIVTVCLFVVGIAIQASIKRRE